MVGLQSSEEAKTIQERRISLPWPAQSLVVIWYFILPLSSLGGDRSSKLIYP